MATPQQLHPVSRELEPSIYLGALGTKGLTAWAGLNLVDVKAGDIIFISGAAGKLKNKQTVVVRIDKAVSAFIGLFKGENIGKMVAKLD